VYTKDWGLGFRVKGLGMGDEVVARYRVVSLPSEKTGPERALRVESNLRFKLL